MSVRFRCPCGAGFRVSSEKAGRKGKCPKCGVRFRIPLESLTEEEEPPVAQVIGPPGDEPREAEPPAEAEELSFADEGAGVEERAGELAPPLIDQARRGLSEKKPEELSRSFWSAFGYPLSSRGVIMMIIASMIFPIALVICKFAFLIGFFGAIFILAYFVSFYTSIISNTCGGEEDVPDWPDVSDPWGEILQPYFRTLGVFFFTFLPMLVFLILGARAKGDAEELVGAARAYALTAGALGILGLLYRRNGEKLAWGYER